LFPKQHGADIVPSGPNSIPDSSTLPSLETVMSNGKGISRRNFLKSSTTGIAAAAAFPTFVPSSAFGANDRVNVGAVGIRGQGGGLINGFGRVPNVSIAAICDVDAN